MITKQQIVDKAREYVGTPFHHQGRLKGVGIDCVGLLIAVAKDLGLPYVDDVKYAWRPDGVSLRNVMEKILDPVEEAGLGDALLFWTFDSKIPAHVGIKTDRGMIHAFSHPGACRVVENGLDKWWMDRFIRAYRFSGVE